MQPEHSFSAQWEVPGLEWSTFERSTVLAAVAVSSSGRLMGANSLFANLLRVGSVGDLVGRAIPDLLVDAREWRRITGTLRAGRSAPINMRFRRSDGETVALRGDIHSVADAAGHDWLLGLLIDTTEEQQLRYAMQRSARLEALGSLTSGVAHDFNNLLTVLVGNLSLVAEELRDQTELFAKLKAARDAATRGADLIRQLLAFARRQPVEADLINPAKIVRNLAPLMGRALGSKVQLETELGLEVGPVRGNAAQLESVIVNLGVNARDAVNAEGRVVISVAERQLDPRDAHRYELSPGNYVEIKVADNGGGIPEDMLARVFEPFFSTKGEQGGTGLGLSMVRSYAAQFDGAAHIESEVGSGTAVSLLFPRCSETLDETSAKTMPLSTLPSGDETVLLLATEEGLRATISQILEVLGYSVVTSPSAEESVALLRKERIDLMIVDSGHVSSLEKLWGAGSMTDSCRILQLASSGTTTGLDTASGRVLLKPFSLADLAQTVRDALDASDEMDAVD